MRKQIFATATMRRPIETHNRRFDGVAVENHDIIVKIALRIARATEQARDARGTASRAGRDTLEGDQFGRWASSLDSDVCQLCVEMQRACAGDPGPFPSDSWSHLNG